MFKKVLNYWKTTKYITSWEVFYRSVKNGTLLDNNKEPYIKFDIKKGYWAADSLLFSKDGEDYLFFELWNNKTKKGSIACSKYENGSFLDYEVVLDLDCHLSFPFVFEHSGDIYMIPETGATHNVRLFKAIIFPYRWIEVKTLVDNIESSDNIIFKSNSDLFLLCSIRNSSPSTCFNKAFSLNGGLDVVKDLYISETSNYGIRNAGQMFNWNNKYIRPGQDCSGDNYGVGLVFYEYDVNSTSYNEKEIRRIDINDIVVENKKKYSGVHTYSKSDKLETIDLRIRKKRLFVTRLFLVTKRIISKLFK